MARESILVVDDEPGVRSMLEAILKDEGYAVAAVGTGEDGVSAATGRPFDALLLDVWLPGIDGIETLSLLKARGVDAEVVMISGHGTIDTAVKATKLGAFDFVEKPLSLEKTLLVLRNAPSTPPRTANRTLSTSSRGHRDFGDSDAVRRVREAEAAASSEAPVLVCGEPAGPGDHRAPRTPRAVARISSFTSAAPVWAASRAPRFYSDRKASPDDWRSLNAARSYWKTSTRWRLSCKRRSPPGCLSTRMSA
jgi:two-component system nitrogen regulation response regulator NtrX